MKDLGKYPKTLQEKLMYHSTAPKNIGAIKSSGLRVGSESVHTMGGAWADEYYGVRPIYLSINRGTYAGQPLAVDVTGLELVADLPGLIDTGAYQAEDGMYWDEGAEPPEMLDFIDENGIIYYDDLLTPGSPIVQAAIELTGTAAVLKNISPERMQIAENKMRITRAGIRKIIREEKRALLRERLEARGYATPLLAFAQAWADLGISVQEQVVDLVDGSKLQGSESGGVSLEAIRVAHENLSKPLKALARTSPDAAKLAEVIDEAYEDFIMIGGV